MGQDGVGYDRSEPLEDRAIADYDRRSPGYGRSITMYYDRNGSCYDRSELLCWLVLLALFKVTTVVLWTTIIVQY